tara:strand:+ start:91 stop:1179 length:1089 start_codon:yes stop_codon:yes gene_type:complete
LVKIGKVLTLFAFKLRLPINFLILKTVFEQFCGGQTVRDSKEVISKNWKFKVGSILDYSVEGQTDEFEFNKSKEAIIETIKMSKNNPGVPLAVFKVTGLISVKLLEKKSANLKFEKKDKASWKKGIKRVNDILSFADSLNIPIMIDAEESWIQKAIDEMALEGMKLFNRKEVIIYNTIQCYKKNQLVSLKKNIEYAKKEGFLFGVKLVRGAYLEKENARSKEMNYETPIHPSKFHTDKEFNDCMNYILRIIDKPETKKTVSLILGTHNEESTYIALKRLKENGWKKGEEPVLFAQLFGMSDNISYNLSNAGYKTAKYLPFGPIREVIPYLFRRAEENTSVKGQTGRELLLIKTELKRRKNIL